MTKAIIFDMDGLMFDTETLSVKGWIEAGRDQGFGITEAMVFEVFGLNPKGLEQFWIRQFGESFNHAQAMERRLSYMKNHVEKNGVPLKPGLLELLSTLKEKDYPFAVASSSQKSMIHYY
ncbi:MAG: HAD family phosphatase, partial [Eubacterium sp.]